MFSAQIVSLFGSGVTTVGLALFAYQLTGGESATAVIGSALFLRILEFLLFSQPAGVLADRFNRKYILIAADVVRFALLALFPFITEVWQIYTLIFLINAVTAFFTSTFEASIPEIVGEEHYVKALSYSRVAVDIEAVAAPAVAGLLIVWLGVRSVFWFDAFTYLVSAALVLPVVMPHLKKAFAPLSASVFLTELNRRNQNYPARAVAPARNRFEFCRSARRRGIIRNARNIYRSRSGLSSYYHCCECYRARSSG